MDRRKFGVAQQLTAEIDKLKAMKKDFDDDKVEVTVKFNNWKPNEAFHLNEELKKDVWETCKKRIEKELEKAEKEFAVL